MLVPWWADTVLLPSDTRAAIMLGCLRDVLLQLQGVQFVAALR